MTFCPNVTIARSIVRLDLSVMNETGSWINFRTLSRTFSISAPSQVSLSFVGNSIPARAISAGQDYFPLVQFFLSNITICDHIQYKFEAQLSCLLSANAALNQNENFNVPFVVRRNFSSPVTVLRASVSRSCVFGILELTPMYPGMCFVDVSVPTFPQAVARSGSISIINGNPFDLEVLGRIITDLKEGSLIWSSNASGVNCLSVFLTDQFNNTIMQCQSDFNLFASLTNASDYQLYGPTRGVSDCKGGLLWCATRVTQSSLIRLKISSPYFTKTISSSIIVLGQGAATNVAILSPVSHTASPLQAGNALPPIQIQITNAARMVLTQTGSIVLRVRLRPKNLTVIRFLELPP